MKEYIKPEVEIISLMANEAITDDEDGLGYGTDLSMNPFNN